MTGFREMTCGRCVKRQGAKAVWKSAGREFAVNSAEARE